MVLNGGGVYAATLRAAAAAVRVPAAGEFDHLLADAQIMGPTVERGDLPADGVSAPMDQPGAGG